MAQRDGIERVRGTYADRRGRWEPTAKLCFVALGLALCLSPTASAEAPRKRFALPDVSSANGPLDLRPQLLATRFVNALPAPGDAFLKATPATAEGFYREYVASVDARIAREYQDRWIFRDPQTGADRARWGDGVVGAGSVDFIRDAPTESANRKTFAEQTLRIRFEATVRNYFAKSATLQAVNKAQQAIASGSQGSVRMSGDGAAGGGSELRYGYNLLTDLTTVEVASPTWRAGVYYSLLHTAGTGAYAQVALTPGPRLLSPTATYQFDRSFVQLSVSKVLSPTVETSITAVQPLKRNDVAPSCGVTVRYSF